jgi:hypothetical protein
MTIAPAFPVAAKGVIFVLRVQKATIAQHLDDCPKFSEIPAPLLLPLDVLLKF